MYVVFIFGIFLSLTGWCHGYVLVQVQKGVNNSKVDAIIHREIPNSQLNNMGKASKTSEHRNRIPPTLTHQYQNERVNRNDENTLNPETNQNQESVENDKPSNKNNYRAQEIAKTKYINKKYGKKQSKSKNIDQSKENDEKKYNSNEKDNINQEEDKEIDKEVDRNEKRTQKLKEKQDKRRQYPIEDYEDDDSRKNLNFKRFEVKQRASEPNDEYVREDSPSFFQVREKTRPNKPGKRATDEDRPLPKINIDQLDSIMVSVDTGVKSTYQAPKPRATDGVDRMLSAFGEWTMLNKPNEAIYRAQQEYNIKPSLIRFRSSDQPTLKLDVTSNSIIKALESLLSSPAARKYTDTLGQKAAILYETALKQFPNLQSAVKEVFIPADKKRYRNYQTRQTTNNMYQFML